MNIHLHIERLIVDGSLALDRRALEAAVSEGMSLAMVQPNTLSLMQRSGSIGALRGGAPIQFGHSHLAWARQIATAVGSSLAGDAQDSNPPVGGTP